MARNKKARTQIKPEITKIIDENYQEIFGITKTLHELLKVNGYDLSRYMISKYLRQNGLVVKGGRNSLMRREWTKQETDILYKYAGFIPFPEVVKKVNKHCLAKRLTCRTKQAVRAKIVDLGLSVDVQDTYLTFRQIEKILNVSYDKLIGWSNRETFKSFLSPVENGNRKLIHRRNFLKFIVSNREEIVECCYPEWEYILSLFDIEELI